MLGKPRPSVEELEQWYWERERGVSPGARYEQDQRERWVDAVARYIDQRVEYRLRELTGQIERRSAIQLAVMQQVLDDVLELLADERVEPEVRKRAVVALRRIRGLEK